MSELIDPHHMRSDLRQYAAAVRRGWILPEKVHSFVPAMMLQIVAKGKHRDAIAAAKVLAVMHQQNDGCGPIVLEPEEPIENARARILGRIAEARGNSDDTRGDSSCRSDA